MCFGAQGNVSLQIQGKLQRKCQIVTENAKENFKCLGKFNGWTGFLSQSVTSLSTL